MAMPNPQIKKETAENIINVSADSNLYSCRIKLSIRWSKYVNGAA